MGAVVGGAAVGAAEVVGAGVGRDGTRHTRHPESTATQSDDHEMLVDELTATQSGPEEPEKAVPSTVSVSQHPSVSKATTLRNPSVLGVIVHDSPLP